MNRLNSLQAKLIGAFVLVVGLGLALASGLFVALRRDDQELQELNRVAAAGPAIFTQFTLVNRGRANIDVTQFAENISHEYEVRVFLLSPTGEVALDSSHELDGKHFEPPDGRNGPWRREGSYLRWDPPGGSPGEGLTLVTSGLPHIGGGNVFPEGRPERNGGGGPRSGPGSTGAGTTNAANPGTLIETYSLVLGVPESTLANAWLDLLPGLSLAGAIALAVAIGLAVLLARSIARPLGRLTVASQQVAAGSYNVDIDTRRGDEVGRLGQAFATMAERVGESQAQMRSMVANVSHDLKTPLTSILGFSQALKTGAAGPEDAARMGEIIHDEASRLAGRLNDLLYLSELDSGQAMLNRERCDLAELTASVVERVSAARPDGAFLHVEGSSGVIIDVDVARLERALENLVENARKYTPENGEIHVTVRPPGSVTIANSAPRLTDEDVPRLFERFYRLDRSRARAAGAGLGLPIAQDIVALHGGELSGELRDGMLVMRLILPAAVGNAPAGP